MRHISIFVFIFSLLLAGRIMAEKADSFQQAKELSVKLNKPILMEFVHED